MSNQYGQQWFPQQDPQRSPYEQPEWGQEYRQPEPVEYNAPQIPYDAPYERGYNPPSTGMNYNEPYQFNPYQKISERRRSGMSVFGIIRGFFYFLGLFIAAFGLFGAFIAFNNSHIITGLGLFFMLGFIIAGFVFFFRLRTRITILRKSQFAWTLVIVTVVAVMAAILEETFIPNFSQVPVGSFLFGCIVMLYGFALMVGAFW